MSRFMDKKSVGQGGSGLNRRRFLQVSALGGAGFLIGCSESDTAAPAAQTEAAAPLPAAIDAELNAFVKIQADNTVTVVVKHLDKGQGVTTGLPAIVAEELDASWSQMRTEFAPADANRYANLAFGVVQGTGGSTSIANSWEQLRLAAAGARAMLVQAAAEQWGVAADTIAVADGRVTSGDQSASFGELAGLAAAQTPPERPALKDRSEFKLLGTNLPRLDSADKTDGSTEFTIDVKRPGMLMAVVARPPRFGGKVASFDASKALEVPGVARVVEIPRGVAVLADSYFTANKARGMLEVEWNFDDAENRSSSELEADFTAMMDQPGLEARNDGDAPAALGSAAQTIEQEFHFPFLAHATMEPMDCVVELASDGCEIWTASQIPTLDVGTTAAITGLDPSSIKIHTRFAGGSFGRRAVPDSDFVAEAVMIAKAIDGEAPVKLLWSREDDMAAGRYRPMAVHRVRAGLDEDGKISAWHHQVASPSILSGTAFAAMMTSELDPSVVEGTTDLPYAIPNVRVDGYQPQTGVPVLWWRSVGHTHNAYAVEVFFDQLARTMGRDPYELRKELLTEHPRHLAVLNKAAEEAGWGTDLGPGRGRGIAVHESFNSFVAEVIEVTMAEGGNFSIDRVVCAVDCGFALTPDVVKAQMEGGIGYGLSSALREAITLTNGEVDQKNFDRYRPLRISEMPKIEVHIVNSGEPPTGVGEPGTPPSAPALANAIADATGRSISRLPIADQLKTA
ncbi:MAG: xanthine dehydrogenase family protein molybdopterin-binding subunit [Pseudomonadota bacterium]